MENWSYIDPKKYDFRNCRTRRNGQGGAYVKEDVVAALKATEGNLSEASRLLGRSRSSLNGFVMRNPDLRDFFYDMEEEFLDETASVARALVRQGDGPTVRFFLSTLGKSRGFTTRTETTGPDGGPIQTTLDVSALDTETLEKLLGAVKKEG